MRSRTALVLAATAALTLAGCGSTAAAPGAGGSSSGLAADAVTIDDAWVKAAAEGMSGAFATLRNTGPTDVTISSATSTAATAVELHETVEAETGEIVMRAKDGGFTIPAGGELRLEPGGNHIMLMGLVRPVQAGDEVTFLLTFSDDSTYEFTARAKDFSGANENYDDGGMGGSDTEPGDE